MRACVPVVQSRCVFLINCGANLNLEEFLGLGDYAGLILAVVDSHRPLDLNNIQEQDEDSPFEVRSRSRSLSFAGVVLQLRGHADKRMHSRPVCEQLYILDSGDPEDKLVGGP